MFSVLLNESVAGAAVSIPKARARFGSIIRLSFITMVHIAGS